MGRRVRAEKEGLRGRGERDGGELRIGNKERGEKSVGQMGGRGVIKVRGEREGSESGGS